ncbi:PQQ-binding-like beta-propeller repeat protein [Aurantiacibacter suaedae]|uniref:outer membrane protein assembly factor BamB family protein n=1 Tax=Aurantiacibacter suaedae TaxID=2545755 RepID=UPI0010F52CF8|nr:PQQ-binding-like beta-propeller repeat protein [Aurantiacibacter suaedae]
MATETKPALRRKQGLALGAALALALGACSTVPGEGTSAAAPSLANVEWDAYLGGQDSAQYSPLDQVNRGNVNQLEVAWEFPTGEGQPPRFNPIVAGGRMIVLAGDGNLVALDPASGTELWRSNIEGRIGARGITYWASADGTEERLMIENDGRLRAINAKTGEFFADFGTDGGVDLRGILRPDGTAPNGPLMNDNPGRIYKDTFIVPLPAGHYDYASSPADIGAYDVRTGALKWVFHVVPREGEFGSDTWPEKDREKFGGVHNWSEFTIDEETGIAYIPTGTARYDFYGGNRPGDNLFANSVLALNAETGERVCHFQTVHHDLWDYDLPTAPKLMTIQHDGEDVPIVIQPAKTGYLFVLDRRDCSPIWPIEEVAVPQSDVPGEHSSPTQPVPTWPERFGRDHFDATMINPYIPEEDQAKVREQLATARNDGPFTPPSLGTGSVSMPGHNGGVNWGGVASDPVRKRVYVVSRELPLLLNLLPDKRESALEAMPNSDDPDVMPYRWPTNFWLQSNGMVPIEPPFSLLTAYDMTTGEKLYEVPNGEILTLEEQGITGVGAQAPRGGPVATAGGLIFVGTATDRAFRARDADTGEVLWEYRFDAATEGVPAIYSLNGRQYITVPVGGVGHFAGGLGLPEPGPSKYVTFALPERQ